MAEPLRRDPAAGLLGGVCAGLTERFGWNVRALRVLFVIGAAASGLGVAVYLLAWAVLPIRAGGERTGRRLRIPGTIASLQVAAGIGCLVLAVLLLFRAWDLWIGDAWVWPVTLVAAGAALIWRQSQSSADAPEPDGSAGGRERRLVPFTGPARGRAALGAALVIGGGLVFLWLNDALAPARDVILAVVVVVVAAGLILAPWWLRLVRGLSAERAERIRSQERAEVAAHLHDSVLQTLALMQKRADDPRAVATLARRQERELRAWLNGAPERPASLAAALSEAAAEVDETYGVAIEVVVVGDRDLDPAGEALTAAAREALTNAAKFAPEASIALFAEMNGERAEVFVRDRGPGFVIDAVPDDRRGVRESIMGRMERHGGRAVIHSAPGEGTEVELEL